MYRCISVSIYCVIYRCVYMCVDKRTFILPAVGQVAICQPSTPANSFDHYNLFLLERNGKFENLYIGKVQLKYLRFYCFGCY